jgi:hypothetical protein
MLEADILRLPTRLFKAAKWKSWEELDWRFERSRARPAPETNATIAWCFIRSLRRRGRAGIDMHICGFIGCNRRDESRSLELRSSVYGAGAASALRWTFAEGFSIQHAEPPKLAKSEPHRRLRHRDVF